MNKEDKIYIAGHRGMVGSALLRKLQKEGFKNLVFNTSSQLDLRRQKDVEAFFAEERPKYVFLAAGKVGGIMANNTYRGEFIYDNLMIQSNIIEAAHRFNVIKLLFLGSSCIYPKHAEQPLSESALLSGPLEPTNEPYAIAKIAGIKLCDAYRSQYGCNFISVMPTNLYGPNDNYDPNKSHVLGAFIRKFHEGKLNNSDEVVIWGTGNPKREFLHVDDLANACYFLMEHYNEPDIINIGTGKDISILELAKLVKKTVGFKGEITNDLSKPDGTPRKLLDINKLTSMGWEPTIELEQGLKLVYEGVRSEPWFSQVTQSQD